MRERNARFWRARAGDATLTTRASNVRIALASRRVASASVTSPRASPRDFASRPSHDADDAFREQDWAHEDDRGARVDDVRHQGGKKSVSRGASVHLAPDVLAVLPAPRHDGGRSGAAELAQRVLEAEVEVHSTQARVPEARRPVSDADARGRTAIRGNN
eukprot:30949-Pelagococcus_subviridis.AAC.1